MGLCLKVCPHEHFIAILWHSFMLLCLFYPVITRTIDMNARCLHSKPNCTNKLSKSSQLPGINILHCTEFFFWPEGMNPANNSTAAMSFQNLHRSCWCSSDNQSVGSSALVVSRWLWPGNITFLEVASMVVIYFRNRSRGRVWVVTWWIAFFCLFFCAVWVHV